MGLQAEEAEGDTGRLSELIALAEVGLQAEKDDDVFFTQAVEAADEAEAAYDRRHGGQSNVGDPIHMNEVEENVFLSQAADEANTAYYRRKADQGNVGEPSHMNEEEENVFLSQAADEAEAAYYKRKADQGNTGDPRHNNRVVVED